MGKWSVAGPCVARIPVLPLLRQSLLQMFASSFDPDHRPLFHFRGYPVWLATILVVVHSVMLVVIASTGGWLAEKLMLQNITSSSADSIKWPSWWQWGTYFLYNGPSVWFLLDMYFLWVFGRELEQRIGRRFFLRLYLLLIAVGTIVIFTALVTRISETVIWAGPGTIHFCIFMAIAFLEPDAPLFILQVRLKYVAAALLAISMLRYIEARSGIGCAILGISVVATYIIMRRYGLSPRFTRVTDAISAALPRPGKKQPARALPYEPKMLPRPEVRDDRRAVEKIDAILEKISKSGVASLDEWEKRELERASKELKRQDE